MQEIEESIMSRGAVRTIMLLSILLKTLVINMARRRSVVSSYCRHAMVMKRIKGMCC